MVDWFESLTHLQQIFCIFAIIGAVLFIIQLVLILVGGGDADAGADVGGHDILDGSGDAHGGADHGDADTSFKLLSYQGLTAFFMMFGLVGLAMSRGSGQGALLSMGVAVAAGMLCMWLVAKLFVLFRGLQSSGTVNLDNAVGQVGRVYLTIKPGGTGQVEVAVQGHLKIYDAVSAENEAIPTDTAVKVTAVRGSTMVVQKI